MPFCSKCGTKLDEEAKFCPKCGTPTDATFRVVSSEPVRKSPRKPMSSLTIALIVIIVVVVIIGLISTVILLGFFPFERRVGSGNLITSEEFFTDFTSVNADSGLRARRMSLIISVLGTPVLTSKKP